MKGPETSGFQTKRITRTYRQTINAPPDVVFPLLCPVREAEWLDGWEYEMIYSQSGLAEEGCVFSTPGDGEADTVWIISTHDKENFLVDFIRFTPGSRTCALKVAVTSVGGTASHVNISYCYTGLTPEGNAWIDSFTQDKFLEAVKFWERSMNHYLETGEKLKR